MTGRAMLARKFLNAPQIIISRGVCAIKLPCSHRPLHSHLSVRVLIGVKALLARLTTASTKTLAANYPLRFIIRKTNLDVD